MKNPLYMAMVAALALSQPLSAAEWKETFLKTGFDPSAPGCGYFVVLGDPHVKISDNAPFRAVIAAAEAMRPRPEFVLTLGDQCTDLCGCHGNRVDVNIPSWRESMEKEIALFKEIVAPLTLPLYHIPGNHDTVPDEDDAKIYAMHFPGWRPYFREEKCGVQFLFLNGRHDGCPDARQVEWIRGQKKTLDPKRAVVFAIHQPHASRVTGMAGPHVVREIFGDWPGEMWMLCGHNHQNKAWRHRMPSGNVLPIVSHCRAQSGFWLYGVRDGSIVKRLFVSGDGKRTPILGEAREEPLPTDEKGILPPPPYPFEGTDGILWKLQIGEDGEKGKYRLKCGLFSDVGHWFTYVDKTVYRLPLKKEAPAATRVGILGRMPARNGKREPVYLSADGASWTQCPDVKPVNDMYIYDIPPEMRSAEWLQIRIDGFSWGSGSSIGGFALLK